MHYLLPGSMARQIREIFILPVITGKQILFLLFGIKER
jgi:hypothetical protein